MQYRSLLVALVVALTITSSSVAQEVSPPREEFRGAWIATVSNLDWPRSAAYPVDAKKAQLAGMIDDLHEAGMNAVIFQVRPAADAFYLSELEPWSQWLTGEQGQAPSPLWDPLAFAIEEAHKRGMELHAWFNPYRSVTGDTSALAPNHVYNEHPEWHLYFEETNSRILDPGLQQVRDYVTQVVMDVVRRYDVDAVHFDDYFYPYPNSAENFSGISDEDQETFEQYPRGFDNIGRWRRDNINLFIEQVYDSIQAVKPLVKFGVSPFGIWRSGIPNGVFGLDAYNTIYIDAPTWAEEGYVDYMAPQLYWKFGGGQDYGKLAPWWSEFTYDRHLYIGHGLYRTDGGTYWDPSYMSAGEIPRQVRFNQAREDIEGSIFFRAENITRFESKGILDSLQQKLYRYPAITPPMAWQDQTAPGAPRDLRTTWSGENSDELVIEWEPTAASASEAAARFYAVYRVNASEAPDPAFARYTVSYLIGVTGETSLTDRPTVADEPYYYFVTALSHNSIESPATAVVSVEGRAVSIDDEQPQYTFRLEAAYPNPFREHVTVAYELDAPAQVSMHVYNSLGQKVRTLLSEERRRPGRHTVSWNGRDAGGTGLASGTYFVTLDVGGRRHTRPVVMVR